MGGGQQHSYSPKVFIVCVCVCVGGGGGGDGGGGTTGFQFKWQTRAVEFPLVFYYLHNNTRSRRPMTDDQRPCVAMTPWLTPHFNKLVASFMLIRVFCVVSMLNKLPPGVCWRGGGGNRLAK